ncbi:MAG: M48 family metalloprotease [Rhodospirillales bacterium]|nr:M48 family metalloprotease [Rhodospirillales bacterium]MCB9996981.1 M48 family metalloprotease [Rhodospirillales bacterium]
MAAGLQTHIWNNNLRSVLLLVSYPFLILLLFGAVAFLGGNIMAYGHSGGAVSGQQLMDTGLAFSKEALITWWPLVFIVVILWFMIAYFFQARMIRALSHAHPVTREEEPELYNLLENLCISRGMTMPRLEIIETHARNAFASGIDEQSYCITVTRGLMQSLQKDELEAVLGHELTHIMNRDVRLLIVSIIFTGMIGFFAQMAWSSIRFSMYGRRKDARVMMFIFAVAAILWIGYMATMFTRFALSRRREYMADAGAVELTKNPDAMMRALLRLSGKDRIPEATDDIALMCIENSRKFFGLFTTHPPLEDRIAAISQVTGTPIPEIRPGTRTDDESRFTNPEDNTNPWVTATRRGRKSPWERSQPLAKPPRKNSQKL